MKKIYLREIRHIIANHTLSNKATGYRSNSKSVSTGIIHKMIKLKWVECEIIDGGFMFVSPSKKMVTVFGPVGIKDKKTEVPAIHTNLIWNNTAQNSHYKSAEIVAA